MECVKGGAQKVEEINEGTNQIVEAATHRFRYGLVHPKRPSKDDRFLKIVFSFLICSFEGQDKIEHARQLLSALPGGLEGSKVVFSPSCGVRWRGHPHFLRDWCGTCDTT